MIRQPPRAVDERRRRGYLEAMGIPLWLPRGAEEQLPPPVVNLSTAPRPEPASAPVAAVPDVRSPAPGPGLPPRAPAEIAAPPLVSPTETAAAGLGWDELTAVVAACQACPELVRNRNRTVFGVGNRRADLMLIGEAPGVDEDRQGEPFVGRAGKLLNLMLQAIGFPREQVFIANILKCRPPNNRDPHAEEAARCEAFLARQLELVAPRVILSVGRISAHNLLKTDAALGSLRGRLHYFGERRIPLVVTYHPAYLLRSPAQKAKSWMDLQLVWNTLRRISAG